MSKKPLIILGYSGSIGTQALEVIEGSNEYELVGVSCLSSVQALSSIKKKHPTLDTVAIIDQKIGLDLLVASKFKRIYRGPNAAISLINDYPEATLLNATVGLAGLAMTLAGIKNGSKILLANKESLVIGGNLVKRGLKEHKKAKIIPVDSEHSALLKLLKGREKPEEIIITCSGGALRDLPLEKLSTITAKDVLAHPTWLMGPRITVDCATMVNKAFEVIEAHYLFDYPLGKIKVLMHDESLIHALVRYVDNSLVAEMGPSDMKIPIAYALNNAKRRKGYFRPFGLADLHFREYNEQRYPAYKFIIDNFIDGSSNMAVINAADEVAVSSFLKGEIAFLDILKVLTCTFNRVRTIEIKTLEDVLEISAIATKEAQNVIIEILGETK